MIENHKTHLFWDLFMGAPEVKQGLTHLGFVSTAHDLSNTCDVTACPGADYCGPGTEWDPVASACVVANPADINLDACVNVSDLLQVLSVFGQCFD